MAHDKMYECQKMTKFKINGEYSQKWKNVATRGMSKGDNQNIRCIHCHGPVVLARQQQDNGPPDHVRHYRSQDAKYCEGGSTFEGVHRMSTTPVGPGLPIFDEESI